MTLNEIKHYRPQAYVPLQREPEPNRIAAPLGLLVLLLTLVIVAGNLIGE